MLTFSDSAIEQLQKNIYNLQKQLEGNIRVAREEDLTLGIIQEISSIPSIDNYIPSDDGHDINAGNAPYGV